MRAQMMMAVSILALTGKALTGSAMAQQECAREMRGYLHKVLTESQVASGVPGAAAALVDLRDTVIETSGVRAAGPYLPTPIKPTDSFQLSSCFKPMTATVAARLVEKGILRWDITIGEVFPELVAQMRPEYVNVTLDQLLMHTGGISDAVLASDETATAVRAFRGTRRALRAMFLREILAAEPAPEAGNPGSGWSYANDGYSIVGAMIERKTGREFIDVAKRELFQPLGISSVRLGTVGNDNAARADQPRPHDENGVALLPGAWNREYYSRYYDDPAGNYSINLPDWAKFVRLHLAPAAGRRPLLSESTLEHLHTPQGIAISTDYAGELLRQAPGWEVAERQGSRLLFHTGSVGVNFTFAAVNPQMGRAVIFAANDLNRGIYAAQGVLDHPVLLGWLLGQALPSIADIVDDTGEAPGDGIVDFHDLVAFFGAYAAGDALADVVDRRGMAPGDGEVMRGDLQAFIEAYLQGQ